MDTELKIDTRIPTLYYPENLNHHRSSLDIEGTTGRQALQAACCALDIMRETRTRMEDAKEGLAKDTTRTDDKKLLEIADLADKLFHQTSARVDKQIKFVLEARESLDKRLADSWKSPTRQTTADAALASDIRQFFRTLKFEKIQELILTAAREGDRQTLDAVFSSPPYVLGVTAEMMTNLRYVATRHLLPQESKQSEAIEKVYDHLIKTSQQYIRDFANDAPQERVKQIRHRRNTAQRALGVA